MGDFGGALVSLGEALDSVRRTFGPSSSEYADVLITTARVHERRNDVRAALEMGDEALAIVAGPARQSTQVVVILQLATLYEDCGELAKARDLYQRADVSVANARDDEGPHVGILGRLAYLNARLGDGAAARVHGSSERNRSQRRATLSRLLRRGAGQRSDDIQHGWRV